MCSFEEIYGYDDIAPVAPAKLPEKLATMAIDDPMFDFTKGTGASDQLAKQLLHDAFVTEVLGEPTAYIQHEDAVIQKTANSPHSFNHLESLMKNIAPDPVTEPVQEPTKEELSKNEEKLAKYSYGCTKIVRKFKTHFSDLFVHDTFWEDFTDHMTDFVNGSVNA